MTQLDIINSNLCAVLEKKQLAIDSAKADVESLLKSAFEYFRTNNIVVCIRCYRGARVNPLLPEIEYQEKEFSHINEDDISLYTDLYTENKGRPLHDSNLKKSVFEFIDKFDFFGCVMEMFDYEYSLNEHSKFYLLTHSRSTYLCQELIKNGDKIDLDAMLDEPLDCISIF